MFLYTASGFEGQPVPCSEGVLEWVPKSKIDGLNLWEGDRLFFKLINEDAPFFSLKLHYWGNRLSEAVLDGVPMELLDVLEDDGEQSGRVRERSMVHMRGDFHRTSHVWVARTREDGGHDLLLQKRSSGKDSFAGCYDISSAGHVPAGAEYLESALRELEEELGIRAEEDDLEFLGYHESRYEGQFGGKPFLNHEKSGVYLYQKPVEESELVLQASEVESVKWMDIHEAFRAAKKEEPGFCLFEDEIGMLICRLEPECQKKQQQKES